MTNVDEKEFQNFLASDGSQASLQPPEAIEKDLVPSRKKLALVYLSGAALGYLLSLAICAQCSIALTALSHKTMMLTHQIPDPWCPLICGAIFGVSPTLVSLFYLSRFQHRFLLFRMAWLPIATPILASLLLLGLGEPHNTSWLGLWLAAALLSPYFLEIVAASLLKQGKWRTLA